MGHQNAPSMPKHCCCLGSGNMAAGKRVMAAQNSLKEASKKRLQGREGKGLEEGKADSEDET